MKTTECLNRRNVIIYELLASYRPIDVTRIAVEDVADFDCGYYTPCKAKLGTVLTEPLIEKLEEYLNQREGLPYLDYRPKIIDCPLLFPSSMTGDAIGVRTVINIRKRLVAQGVAL
jgi:hypothetical protein